MNPYLELFCLIKANLFRILDKMGKVRTSAVKIIARQIIKEYEPFLSPDSFDHNKDIVSKVSITGSKRFRNQIAGYLTHQLKLKKLREQSYED